jgi:hypothetical protein
MASIATRADFVSLVAEEIASGIDRALQYWLGRIELEIENARLSGADRIHAIEQILEEYKVASGTAPFRCFEPKKPD